MNDIKFRGKRVDNGEWVKGYVVKTLSNQSLIAFDTENKIRYFEANPETVGQFTGLPFDIFQHDIISPVQYPKLKYLVIWNDYNCCFSAVDSFEYNEIIKGGIHKENILCNKGNIKRDWILKNEIKPIGTIHDNPELL